MNIQRITLFATFTLMRSAEEVDGIFIRGARPEHKDIVTTKRKLSKKNGPSDGEKKTWKNLAVVDQPLPSDNGPTAGETALDLRLDNSQGTKSFPFHWGNPPTDETRDYRPLPAGFGCGSSTLHDWIAENLEKDNEPVFPSDVICSDSPIVIDMVPFGDDNRDQTVSTGPTFNSNLDSSGSTRPFPLQWGNPPTDETRDYRPLPEGFGCGSSTLNDWIINNLKKENKPVIQSDVICYDIPIPIDGLTPGGADSGRPIILS